MIFLLILAIIQNAFAAATNDTNSDMLEALKYFQAAHTNNAKDYTNVVVPTPKTPKPNILSVIHELEPNILHRPVDFSLHDEHNMPMLESRDVDDVETNAFNNLDSENQRRMFIMLKTMLDDKKNPEKTLKRHPGSRIKKFMTKNDSRRISKWLKNIFNPTTTTTTIKNDIEDKNGLRLIPSVGYSNLTLALNKLHSVLEKLNENVLAQNLRSNRTNGFFIVKMPIKTDISKDFSSNYRKKRDILEERVNNTTVKVVQEEPVNVTDEKKTRRINDEILDGYQMNTKADNQPNFDNANQRDNSEIKTKLIEHLKVSFEDIKSKISALNGIKKKYSTDNSYRIGYVLANIDTLNHNLSKLQNELESHRYIWDERKLLDLFDRLKSSDHVVGKLIEIVNMYAKNQKQ